MEFCWTSDWISFLLRLFFNLNLLLVFFDFN